MTEPTPPRRGRRGPAPGTPRAPRMTRAQREAQLIDIAEQVFAEKGYQETTVDEIANRAGITKPVIYDHFGSKQGLLLASLTRAQGQLRDYTVQAVARNPGIDDPRTLVTAMVRSFFDFIDEHRGAFTLIQSEGAAAAFGQGMESIRSQQAELIVEVLRSIAPLDGTRPEIIRGYAEVLIGACERIATYQSQTDRVSAENATDIVLAMIWPGVEQLGT